MMLLAVILHNIPEGMAIGVDYAGLLTGGAEITSAAAQFVVSFLPYLLSFAAGAMVYVVVEELIPEMSAGKHSNVGTIFFACGFSLMMVLDVVLG